jgi:hypothetical protein
MSPMKVIHNVQSSLWLRDILDSDSNVTNKSDLHSKGHIRGTMQEYRDFNMWQSRLWFNCRKWKWCAPTEEAHRQDVNRRKNHNFSESILLPNAHFPIQLVLSQETWQCELWTTAEATIYHW